MEAAMLAWDRAVRGEHGGAHNPNRDPQTGRFVSKPVECLKSDNVRLEDAAKKLGTLDYGNSAQAGLRRLEKAASSGDQTAAALLRRVVNPNDNMSVNGACVQMGWRKPTRTITLLRSYRSIILP